MEDRVPKEPGGSGRKRRVQFDFSQRSVEHLEYLRKITDAASWAEVVRRALGLYEVFVEHRNSGGSVIFRDSSGAEREILLLEGWDP